MDLFIISPLTFRVKAVDPPDKKYAAALGFVHRCFSILKSCGTIKDTELRVFAYRWGMRRKRLEKA